MSYPTLSAKAADEIVEALKDGDEADQELVQWVEGHEVDLEAVADASAKGLSKWEEVLQQSNGKPKQSDRTRLDATMAPLVHTALKSTHPTVLDDKGFWRYLALFEFAWFIEARRTTKEKFLASDYGGSNISTRGFHDSHYIVKAFRRGLLSYDPSESEPYERATRINDMGFDDIDVWDSHFHRARFGRVGVASKALFDAVTQPDYFGFNETRTYAILVTREHRNLLLDVYDYDDALDFGKSKRRRAAALYTDADGQD